MLYSHWHCRIPLWCCILSPTMPHYPTVLFEYTVTDTAALPRGAVIPSLTGNAAKPDTHTQTTRHYITQLSYYDAPLRSGCYITRSNSTCLPPGQARCSVGSVGKSWFVCGQREKLQLSQTEELDSTCTVIPIILSVYVSIHHVQ